MVKDEDIGEFWEAVRAIELSQADPTSAEAWGPATLLRTGADGTVRTELAAGDYLFCAVWNSEHGRGIRDCTYQDVTVGQDRVLNLAVSFALVFGHPGNLWAWTYSIFVVSFFMVRQRFDERACEQKYGPEKWAEYQARVKYRIFPGVY